MNHDIIWGIGNHDTVSGSGGSSDGIQTFSGDGLLVQGVSGGSDLIGVVGDNNQLSGDVGDDTIWASGNSGSIDGLGGNNLIGFFGNNELVAAGAGDDTIWGIGDNDTISADGGNNTVFVAGDDNLINLGSGSTTLYAANGAGGLGGDTVAGGGLGLVFLGGTNATFADSGPGFDDTVVGFDAAKGDTIQTPDNPTVVAATATPANGGLDTVISFSDGSTLTLKFVTHVDSTFFHS